MPSTDSTLVLTSVPLRSAQGQFSRGFGVDGASVDAVVEQLQQAFEKEFGVEFAKRQHQPCGKARVRPHSKMKSRSSREANMP